MNSPIQTGLSAPLRVQSDMPALWHNVETDFDTAANILVDKHRKDGAAKDVPAMDLRTWAVRAESGQFALSHLAGHEPPRPLRSTAFSALCSRVGAPTDFIKKLPAELQLANLSFLMAAHPRPLPSVLRMRGNEVSAIVSEKYAALDAEQFVETVRLALKAQGLLEEVQVRAVATGTTDALRLVLPSRSAEIQLGDVSHVGLDVSTSSFGKSAIHVTGQVWRKVCRNGLRVPESMGRISMRHVGETERLRLGLRDAVPTALTHASGLMDHWKKAVATEVQQVGKFIEQMRLLTLAEKQNIEQALQLQHDKKELPESTTAYNLINAVTAAAHQAAPARRLELESLAGNLLVQEVA